MERPDTHIDDDARWLAVLARDPAADGRFFTCVRTTGVYCRPTCLGRPLRRNVFFVATPAEASAAGMRPCKRCRPEAGASGPPPAGRPLRPASSRL